jgi:dethiobiotin synthetase
VTTDLFVTGTDTGVGKTLLAAVLVAALNRRYWKPIQTGAIEGTDRQQVMQWTGLPAAYTHPETLLFDPPVSPHLAAQQKGIAIDIQSICRPSDPSALVIEGAGGILVPINKEALMLDLIRHLSAPVLVAARTSLGTINHTLLTVHTLRNAGVEIRGVVMIGKENADNRHAIEHYGSVPVVGAIPWIDIIDRPALLSVFENHFDRTAFV